jgi:hypothetical protein
MHTKYYTEIVKGRNLPEDLFMGGILEELANERAHWIQGV